MMVYAKLVKEVCKHVLTEHEEGITDKIINEELVHEEILKSLITKTR